MLLGTNSRNKNFKLPIPLTIDGVTLEVVPKYKYLGLMINGQLTMTDHCSKTVAMVASKINTLSFLRRYLKPETLLQIYKTTILPLIEYSNQIFSLIPVTYRNKFQKLQNRALKTIYMHLGDMSNSDLHIRAKLPSVHQRSERQLACLMYKRSKTPEKYPQIEQGNQSMNTRANEKIRFSVPKPNFERFKVYPLYRGSQLWDTLTIEQQRAPSYESFKNRTLKDLDLNTYPV